MCVRGVASNMRFFSLMSASVLTLTIVLNAQIALAAEPLYEQIKVVPLGGPDRWDLLTFDPSSNRVYVAHGDRVSAVDGIRGTLVGEVSGIAGGAHGVATIPQSEKAYTDDGKAGLAIVFNLQSLKVERTIGAEADADAVVYDRSSGNVFVINGDSGKITVIDSKTDRPVATIDLDGKLELGAVDGSGKLFVNIANKREIARIDTHSNKIDGRWAIDSCDSPHGLAIDTDSRRLFASCENKVMVVVDAETGHIVASLPIGARTDGAAFDPVRKRAFSSNGDGTLTVIAENGPNDFSVAGTIQTMIGARTMTLDPKTGRLYLVAADTVLDPQADPADARHRYKAIPGSAKLLFLDPTN